MIIGIIEDIHIFDECISNTSTFLDSQKENMYNSLTIKNLDKHFFFGLVRYKSTAKLCKISKPCQP
ncbi:hypothetical protein CLV48_102239 [Cecembia rubra]|uniref:Uncharacterized protein n=1 Tax=Cecembia rubra TaxID=1485585 RepID=A0A2P8EAD4_9BACT|nr:hypothetical protein CLV48_102239 [Cecembia rubra]